MCKITENIIEECRKMSGTQLYEIQASIFFEIFECHDDNLYDGSNPVPWFVLSRMLVTECNEEEIRSLSKCHILTKPSKKTMLSHFANMNHMTCKFRRCVILEALKRLQETSPELSLIDYSVSIIKNNRSDYELEILTKSGIRVRLLDGNKDVLMTIAEMNPPLLDEILYKITQDEKISINRNNIGVNSFLSFVKLHLNGINVIMNPYSPYALAVVNYMAIVSQKKMTFMDPAPAKIALYAKFMGMDLIVDINDSEGDEAISRMKDIEEGDLSIVCKNELISRVVADGYSSFSLSDDNTLKSHLFIPLDNTLAWHHFRRTYPAYAGMKELKRLLEIKSVTDELISKIVTIIVIMYDHWIKLSDEVVRLIDNHENKLLSSELSFMIKVLKHYNMH